MGEQPGEPVEIEGPSFGVESTGATTAWLLSTLRIAVQSPRSGVPANHSAG